MAGGGDMTKADKRIEQLQRITPEQLAEAHWVWLESLLRKLYVDAFLHGYKHGLEAEP